MKVQCLFEAGLLSPTRSWTAKKQLISHMCCQRAVKRERRIVKCFCHENEYSLKNKTKPINLSDFKNKKPSGPEF